MAVQQVIQRLVIAILCGWFSIGIAVANTSEKIVNEFSEDEIASFGCLGGGAGLVTVGYVAGPSEALMLWGGGLLVPSGSAALAISLLGGLGFAGCSIGATLAPTVAWFSVQVDRLFSYAAISIKSRTP